MKLSRRERATTLAALLELQLNGVDPAEVIETAATLIGMGTPEAKAYERAFGKVIAQRPSLQAPLQRIEQQIGQSDSRTVARYNIALARYVETGDKAHLEAIAATAVQDMAEMGSRTGDPGFSDNLPDRTPEPNSAPTSEAPARAGWGQTGYRASEAKEGE